MSAIKPVLTNMLAVLSRSFWPSLLLTLLLSFLYLYCYDPVETGGGLWAAIRGWTSRVRSSRSFRRLLVLAFYVSLVLQATLLSRGYFADPLSNSMGGWRLWVTTNAGAFALVTSTIENLVMLLPLTVLLPWACGERLAYTSSLTSTVLGSAKLAGAVSLSIEMLQLLLHLGTWQLSDLVYNTLGGALGGLLWWAVKQMRHPG